MALGPNIALDVINIFVIFSSILIFSTIVASDLVPRLSIFHIEPKSSSDRGSKGVFLRWLNRLLSASLMEGLFVNNLRISIKWTAIEGIDQLDLKEIDNLVQIIVDRTKQNEHTPII